MKKPKWILSLGMLLSLTVLGTACSDTSTNKVTTSESTATSTKTTTAVSKSVTPPKDSAPKPSKSGAAKSSQLNVYYFDVGQGDSILIQTPKGENILIDGGNNDKGDDVVRYLKTLHVTDLTAVIATHPDADHIGGLDTVLQNVVVKSVYTPKVTHSTQTYEDFLEAVKQEGLKLKEAKAGVTLGLTGAAAKFVGPVKSYGNEMNDWSAVVKVTFGSNSFLFTGDAPIRSEEDMIAAGEDLRADVLKVGHHGAHTSTSQSFLSAVKPKYAIISVGKGNRYGHPTDEILNRLKQNGIKIYRTDEMKTILAISDGKNVSIKSVPGLTPNHSTVTNTQPSPAPEQKPAPSDVPTINAPSNIKLQAKLDEPTPKQYETIHLTVTGVSGASYTATVHYKSTDTDYTGKMGTPLPIRISRAASGYEVVIDIAASVNGKTYTTQTSFVPQ